MLISPALSAGGTPDSVRTDDTAFSRGPVDLKTLALTFDACSTMRRSGYDSAVTRILEQTRTPASIFVCGRWVEQWPEQAKALAGDTLFELENHSYRHPHLRTMTTAEVKKELLRAQEVIEKVTGRRPTLFRPPYGEYDRHIIEAADSIGLETVEYSLPSGDPDPHATKQRLINYVEWKARNGAIIVMHINGRGWHTAEALPSIIEGLKKRGFRFVKVTDLIAESKKTQTPEASSAPSRAPSLSP